MVDDQAVGLVEHLLERLGKLRMDRLDLLQPVLAFRVVRMRVHAHRARTVEGDQCRDVVEVIWLQLLEQRTHAVGIELEHTQRVAARQQFVCLLVVERNLRMVNRFLAVGLDVPERVTDHRQVGQTQEVHLHQTQCLTRVVFECRRHRAIRALQQRRRVSDRLRAHDRGACVHTRLANQALDAHRLVGDSLGIGIRLIQFAVFTRLRIAFRTWIENVVQRHVLATRCRRRQRLGNQLAHRELVAHDAR